MWDILGFSNNPFSAKPLRIHQEDVDLLIGRKSELENLLSVLSASEGGAIIISGYPGVGKTSFLNISQHLIHEKRTSMNSKIMASREPCYIRAQDNPRDIAQRALWVLSQNAFNFCAEKGSYVPENIKKIHDWMNSTHETEGISLNISILGFGGGGARTIKAHRPSDCSFEQLKDIIQAVSREVREYLHFESSFIVLDNTENIADQELSDCLMAFRDTLFEVQGVWWIIVGASGVASSLRSIDPRVADRISASIELEPIALKELYGAIEKRVQKFQSTEGGRSPIPQAIYEHLYKASEGEIRYVFQKCNDICREFVAAQKMEVQRALGISDIELSDEDRSEIEREIQLLIGKKMTRNQIPSTVCRGLLRKIIKHEFDGHQLRQADKAVLKKIGDRGSARQRDYKEFGKKSGQDFSQNFLGKLFDRGLLSRSHEGAAVSYSLRGTAVLARDYGLLDDV